MSGDALRLCSAAFLKIASIDLDAWPPELAKVMPWNEMTAAWEAADAALTADAAPVGVGGEVDYVDIANRAQEATGRGIYPSTVKAVLDAAARAAPDAEGREWVLVPREPTERMLRAAAVWMNSGPKWDAMLAARPQPEDRKDG